MTAPPDLPLLKAAVSRQASLRLEVALPDGTVIGALLLAGSWVLQDTELLAQVTHWRQRNMRMFLSQFEATVERTTTYFRDLALARPDRALFFLLSSDATVIGHLGIANWTATSAELDNVVRGVGGGHPQLMYFAEHRLLQWVFKHSAVQTVVARVLSYNWMAQDLHASIGFVPTQAQTLKKVITADGICHQFVPPDSANVSYRCMVMALAAPPRGGPRGSHGPSPPA